MVCKTDEHLKKEQFLLLVRSKFENPFEIRLFCLWNIFHIYCIFHCCTWSIDEAWKIIPKYFEKAVYDKKKLVLIFGLKNLIFLDSIWRKFHIFKDPTEHSQTFFVNSLQKEIFLEINCRKMFQNEVMNFLGNAFKNISKLLKYSNIQAGRRTF